MTHKSTRVLIQSQTTNVSKVFGGSIEPSIYTWMLDILFVWKMDLY